MESTHCSVVTHHLSRIKRCPLEPLKQTQLSLKLFDRVHSLVIVGMTARMTFMWTVVVLIFYDLVLCFFCCVLVYRTSFRQSCPLQVNLLFVRFCTPSVGRLGCHGRPQAATWLLQSTRSSAACCISASVGGCSYSLYVGRFPPGRHFP